MDLIAKTWQYKIIQNKIKHIKRNSFIAGSYIGLHYIVQVLLFCPLWCSVLLCSVHQSCNAALRPAGGGLAQKVRPPSNRHPVLVVCSGFSGEPLSPLWHHSVTVSSGVFKNFCLPLRTSAPLHHVSFTHRFLSPVQNQLLRSVSVNPAPSLAEWIICSVASLKDLKVYKCSQ